MNKKKTSGNTFSMSGTGFFCRAVDGKSKCDRFVLKFASVILAGSLFGLVPGHSQEPKKGVDRLSDAHRIYLKEHAEDADWFINAADGYGGIPLILLRSMPDLAPEIFGVADEQFSKFGYIPAPGGALPLGLSWRSFDEKHPPQPLHPVSLTCGACHVARVRLEDGTFMQLVGAPNTQFDVRKWRRAFELMTHKLLDTPENVAKTADQLKSVIAAKPPGYFYRGEAGVSELAEEQERQFYAANALKIVEGFADRIRLGELAIAKQKATSYSKHNAPPLDGGSIGQSDGSGDLLPRLLLFDSIAKNGVPKTVAEFMGTKLEAMPDQLATATDILSTWKQASQHIAQIDGSVKSPLYRNVAASLAVAGDPAQVNVANAERTARFIGELPPPSYPFPIDAQRAERGGRLFREHCAVCHKSFNDVVYPVDLIGTDPNRAKVLNPAGLDLFLRYFKASVPADYELTDAEGRLYRPHDLPQGSILFDRTQPERQGYVTNGLEGLWARAPYLHNGAVPTLYHLLVPAERPGTFVRGAINYDTERVGFFWDPAKLAEIRRNDPNAGIFDTSWDGCSKFGHDRNLTISRDGRILRQGWGGPLGAGDFRVRLDWGGAEHKQELSDLLEFLKVL